MNNDDFEDWEEDSWLYENKKWKQLLDLRLRRAKDNPNDLYAQYYLGEAYNFNKKHEEAISFIYELHKKYPENHDFTHIILDALFALGKNENDINWVLKPNVLRINQKLIDKCYKYVRKMKICDINDLYHVFLEEEFEDYFAFNKEELIEALKKDGRFYFNNNSSKELTVVET